MKLYFSVVPKREGDAREELLRALSGSLFEASYELNEEGNCLCVHLPDGSDVRAVCDALSFRVGSLGVRLTLQQMPAGNPGAAANGCGAQGGYGAAQNTCAPPINPRPAGQPIHAPAPVQKPKRQVGLPTFIVSLIAVALVFAILGGALTIGVGLILAGNSSDVLGTTNAENAEDYSGKISLIDEMFRQYGLYDTDGVLLLDQMLKAYTAATGDDYAAYYTEEEYKALMSENNASMVGIGVMVVESADPRGAVVVSVFPDSPAQAAGILPGDVIVGVGSGENAVSFKDISYESAMALVKGEAGTEVTVTVSRGGEPRAFTMTRAAVTMVSVSGHASQTDPRVGIVRISQFDTATPVQFRKTMEELISGGCTAFVYDLRNNPGGDLKSVTAVLAFFLNEGDLVLSTVAKTGDTEKSYLTPAKYNGDYAGCSIEKSDIGRYRSYPNAVLVNGNTASAAELVTAALRDYHLTQIVGEKTFGKGILQSIYDLSHFGYKGAIKLTTGYYCPPCGENYHGVGITPEIQKQQGEAAGGKNFYLLTEAEDDQLRAAVSAAVRNFS